MKKRPKQPSCRWTKECRQPKPPFSCQMHTVFLRGGTGFTCTGRRSDSSMLSSAVIIYCIVLECRVGKVND